jgi:hypothetical protein
MDLLDEISSVTAEIILGEKASGDLLIALGTLLGKTDEKPTQSQIKTATRILNSYWKNCLQEDETGKVVLDVEGIVKLGRMMKKLETESVRFYESINWCEAYNKATNIDLVPPTIEAVILKYMELKGIEGGIDYENWDNLETNFKRFRRKYKLPITEKKRGIKKGNRRGKH